MQSDGYCMALDNTPSSYTGTLSIASIGAYLISVGYLSQYAIMYSTVIRFNATGGAGSYSLTLTSPVPATRKVTWPG